MKRAIIFEPEYFSGSGIPPSGYIFEPPGVLNTFAVQSMMMSAFDNLSFCELPSELEHGAGNDRKMKISPRRLTG